MTAVSDTDAGTGAEGSPASVLVFSSTLGPCGDWGGEGLAPIITDTDSGALTEQSPGAGPGDGDTGSGADAGEALALADIDALIGDELLNWYISVAGADTAASTEVVLAAAKQIVSTDTGTFSDSGEQIVPDIFDTDSGSAAEASTLSAHLADDDPAQAAEGPEGFTKPDTDMGLLSDNQQVSVLSADSASAADASAALRLADAEVAVAAVENASFPDAKFDTDAATGAESSLVSSRPSDADTATFTEAAVYDIPGFTTAIWEAFSVSRVAILSPALRGAEAPGGVFYGVRSGAIQAQMSALPLMGDDLPIGMWYDLSTAQVHVEAAYIGYEQLGQLVRAPAQSDGSGDWSVPYAVQQLLAGAEVPLIMQCTARDPFTRLGSVSRFHAQQPGRVLAFVLYRVRIGTVSVAPVSYKQGVAVTFSGVALYSQQDEAGNALPAYSGTQSGREVGRIVSIPDTGGGLAYQPIAPVFGQGS